MEKTIYEKACEALNQKPLELSQFDFIPERHRKSAFAEQRIIARIEVKNMESNDGKPWYPNFLSGEWYYFPWLKAKEDKTKPSGVGFSFYGSGCGCTHASLGSRLVCKNEKIAQEVYEECPEDYQEWIEMVR